MEISGIILAGGKSSRMKFNKAFAEIGGQRIIDILIDKFQKNFAETIIISNEPHLFSNLGVQVHTDLIPSLGPLSGIHAGLTYARNDRAFVCGCDMPFVSMEIVEYLLSRLGEHDSAVTEIEGRLQPTAAVYSRRCLPLLNESLERGWLKLVRLFYEQLDAVVVNESELAVFGDVNELFFNINDVDDLEKAQTIAGRLLK
ncbi:MAG: molybdenum cofactor guanylyltransferase [Syntrophomonas sp.]